MFDACCFILIFHTKDLEGLHHDALPIPPVGYHRDTDAFL